MTSKLGFGLALQNYVAAGESLGSRELLRLGVTAENLGFTSVWVWDHLLLGSQKVFPVQESLSVLTAVAVSTEVVRLGTGILILPIRNPIELAKRVATIDDLSNGRVTLGVAAGWYEREFRACGVLFETRGKQLETNIEIMRKLWSEDRVTGTYGRYELKNVNMEPKPIQKPNIPLWLGGYTEKAHERLGRLGDGWVSYFYNPESFKRSWERILENTQRASRDPTKLGNCNMLPVRVGDNMEDSSQILKAFIGKYCDLPAWSEATAESGIVGSAKDCIASIESYVEAGVQNIVIMPAVANLSEIDQQVKRFATEVVRSF